MYANVVKSVIYEMIENGELKFELEKGFDVVRLGNLSKSVSTTKLKVLNCNNVELCTSEIRDKPVKWNSEEIENAKLNLYNKEELNVTLRNRKTSEVY